MKSEDGKTKKKRQLTGVVVSNYMENTVIVRVTRLLLDNRYRKYVRKSKRIKVHTNEKLETGVKVTIEETSPRSKEKSWKVITNKG